MKSLISQIVNIGIHPALLFEEQKKIRSLNVGGLIAAVIVLALVVLNLVTAHYFLALSYIFLLLCIQLICFLQYHQLFSMARYFTIGLIPAFFAFISLCYHNNTEVLLLLNIAVIVLLLDSWWQICVLTLLDLFAFIFIRLYNGQHAPLVESLPPSRDIISVISLFVLMGMALLYNKYEQQRYRRQLEALIRQNEEKALRLENLNRAKEKILSTLSHNLRQPLTAMRSLLQLEEEPSAAYISDFTGKVRNNLDNVLLSLDNTLRWSHTRLKGLIPVPRYCSVQDTLLQIEQQFEMQLAEKQLAFSRQGEDDTLLYADPVHLAIILRNLVSNAIKFTPKGGSITVGVRTLNGMVEFSVTDSGIGMNEIMQQQLFNLERQHIPSYGTENEPGVGLGLLLVKELVEINGGNISLTSVIKKGTMFQVTLPASYV
jgi:signal transduction histidine kinase